MKCVVCNDAQKQFSPTDGDSTRVVCLRCGEYTVSGFAEPRLTTNEYDESRWKISAWLRDNSGVLLNEDNLVQAVNSRVPSMRERAERVLRWLYKNSAMTLGHTYSMPVIASESQFKCLVPISWSRSETEVCRLIDTYLAGHRGFIRFPSTSKQDFQLTPAAFDYLESGGDQSDSPIGFCAMWFDPSISEVWLQAIQPAIEDAGWEPQRVDGVEHAGKIDDEIVAGIRRSRFLVADFTGQRGGVYFEAGLAQGLGKPVIWTCREDQIAQLHFDIRQYNCVTWMNEDLPDFRKRLCTRIEAVLGRGPRANAVNG